MNVSTKKGAIPAAMVVVIGLAFGVLSSAQYTTMLSSLSNPRVRSFANPHLGLTRHTIKEVSPSKPELRLSPTAFTQSPPVKQTHQLRVLPVLTAGTQASESAGIQRRRIPARSADDPASF